jgi:cob(I)alamin adenosyltransferase
MSKIYTKTGDKGTTSLFGGEKVSKFDVRIIAQGSVDELSCCIGLCTALMPSQILDDIQTMLFHIGAIMNIPKDNNFKIQMTNVTEEDIKKLEDLIDGMNSNLPELKNFILPGGDDLISRIHFARAVCRRAERDCVAVENIDSVILKYINRLSDYLFTLARYVSYKRNPPIPEKIVKQRS